MKKLDIRFWIESALAAVSAAALALTVITRTWIEVLLRADPDQGSGMLEWIIVAVLVAVTLTSVTLAARDRGRGAERDGSETCALGPSAPSQLS